MKFSTEGVDVEGPTDLSDMVTFSVSQFFVSSPADGTDEVRVSIPGLVVKKIVASYFAPNQPDYSWQEDLTEKDIDEILAVFKARIRMG